MSWAGFAAIFVCLSLTMSMVHAEELPLAPTTSLSDDIKGIPDSGTIEFAVYRKGDKIGRHTLTFTEKADKLTVDVDVALKVRLLFVTVYRYEHTSTEVWDQGKLTSLESETRQNGKEWFVKAECDTTQMQVMANDGASVVDGSLFPTTYWNVASLETPRWFNTQFGSPLDVNVSPLGPDVVQAAGQPVEALRYNVTGFIAETQKPVNMDLWYGANGQLVKLQFAAADGSLIEYKRTS